MSVSTIKAQIKAILEGVTGIGVVHSRVRHSRSIATFLSLMKASGIVNGWIITRQATTSERDTMPTVNRMHLFKIIGIYTLDDEAGSEDDFQDLIEEIFDAFKSNYNLNGTALNSDLIQVEDVRIEDYGGTDYHSADLSLAVYERSLYS